MLEAEAITITEFLSAFFPAETESVHIRAFAPREYPNSRNLAAKRATTREQLANDADLQAFLRELNRTRGIYFVVNSGGDSDADINRFNACFAESDNATIPEQYERLSQCPLEPSILVQTKKSVHAYWLLAENISPEAWREIQSRLINYFGADPKIKNPSRVMRLPHFNHLTCSAEGAITERHKVTVTHWNPELKYAAAQLLEHFPPVPAEAQHVAAKPKSADELTTWDALLAELRARMLTHPTCRIRGIKAQLKGICHNGKSDSALFLNLSTNAFQCTNDNCTTADVLRAFGLPEKPLPALSQSSDISQSVEVAETPEGKIEGIYSIDDISDEIDALYETGLRGGVSTGWGALDEIYTVKLGRFTVWTGMPGAGKTSVLNALLVNLAKIHDWRFLVCSPESQPLARHAAELISIYTEQPFGINLHNTRKPRMTFEQMQSAKEWLAEYFTFVYPSEDMFTMKGILALAESEMQRRDYHGLIVDPYNEIEHRRPSAMTETEYVSQILTLMRRFARKTNVHLWLVAHPTKLQKVATKKMDANGMPTMAYPVPTLYDINGSAGFRNKCDMGVVVWRDMSDAGSETQIHVQKVRFREEGALGRADLWFDYDTGCYTEGLNSNSYAYAGRDY